MCVCLILYVEVAFGMIFGCNLSSNIVAITAIEYDIWVLLWFLSKLLVFVECSYLDVLVIVCLINNKIEVLTSPAGQSTFNPYT